MPSLCPAPLRPATQDAQNSVGWLGATEGGGGSSTDLWKRSGRNLNRSGLIVLAFQTALAGTRA